MRHRIRDVVNTVLELGAELVHDLWWAHGRRKLGIPPLEERVLELERQLATCSQKEWTRQVMARPVPHITGAWCPSCGRAMARAQSMRGWICEVTSCSLFEHLYTEQILEDRYPSVLSWSDGRGG